MARSSYSDRNGSFIGGGFRYLRDLLRNSYFWGGLGLLLVACLLLYFVMNVFVMPAYTRHGSTVRVPSVLEMSYEEALRTLEAQDLRAERVERRFDPERPRDSIVEQSPAPEALVKPGRRIYLTVNTGRIPMVKIPPLEGLSLREARNRLQAVGLKVKEERPDTFPSPYRNTITRHEPGVGDSLAEGASVVLWFSTGLGDRYVAVPDVAGKPVSEARRLLHEKRLRAVIVGLDAYRGPSDPPIARQSREPGTRVREGFEIRLFLEGAEDEEESEPAPSTPPVTPPRRPAPTPEPEEEQPPVPEEQVPEEEQEDGQDEGEDQEEFDRP